MLVATFLCLHMVNNAWIHWSAGNHSKIIKIYMEKFKNKMDIEFGEEFDAIFKAIYQELELLEYEQFYFISLTMSVIGYGDSVSMPNLQDNKEDFATLYLTMLVGLFSFTFFSGQLGSFLKEAENGITITH